MLNDQRLILDNSGFFLTESDDADGVKELKWQVSKVAPVVYNAFLGSAWWILY